VRFEEEMQYDYSTVEKLKSLEQAKQEAIRLHEYERVIQIK